MRMTEFPMLEEIKDEYLALRRQGNSRNEATQQLISNYADEITKGVDDDGVIFWIGLADAQYYRKEITEEVAKRGIIALDRLAGAGMGIAVGDIERRRNHYAAAPMSEKKVGKPRPKFRCQWNIGDTFAYQLRGPRAERYGIAGKYCLFRKVDAYECSDGKLVPAVTVSLWDREPFPRSTDEFCSVPMLRIEGGGRCGAPKDKYEYRAQFWLENKKQLMNLPLQFVGNFQDVPMPEDEVVFTKSGCATILLPKRLDEDCGIFWKMHIYYTRGIDLD